MNFLAEVLSSAKEAQLEHAKIKITELTTAVDNAENNILTYLDNVYVKFRDRPKNNKSLARKCNSLQKDIINLKTHVEDVVKRDIEKSEDDAVETLNSLSNVDIKIGFINSLLVVNQILLDIKGLQGYSSECMRKILEARDIIETIPQSERLDIHEELYVIIAAEKNSLLNKLTNQFNDDVVLRQDDNHYNIMKINISQEKLCDTLTALYYYKTSITPLDAVTKFLWNHVFVPVVDCITTIEVGQDGNFATLKIAVENSTKKSSYQQVFANIKTILKFLSENFNIKLDDDLTTLSYIGRDVRDNLSELIIKHCLEDTIPSTAEGLKAYNIVIEATNDLEKALVSSQIFAEDTTSILDYANNIDVLFINKKCQDYLVVAQDIMKKDLHDLVEVGESENATNPLEISSGFPKCSVSRSVMELLILLEKILIQASSSSDVCAGRLYCTVKNICEKYGMFVPECHKKLLQTIPQQVAIFYNNCMYISFTLREWTNSHMKTMPSILNIRSTGLTDEGSKLVDTAQTMFNEQVEHQVKQIAEIMKDSGLQQRTLEHLESQTDKCVRQSLRQQELLKTVWHKVLPYSVYNRTLGVLLDTVCNHLINAVTKFEDISSDAAEQLVEILKMVQTRGPKLFTDPKEVSLFVPSWYKMSELVFVLSASLLDINDRWADGKGPLALQFKPEELRQLVRALFQNTERRSALLAKIHDL